MGRTLRGVFLSSSPEQTRAVARRLARSLEPGSVLAISGPLGSGKTEFVKGLAAGLGLPAGAAASPTFTLLHEHPGEIPLFHADLYRLERPEQAADLGLDEYAEAGGILAVEWAERGAGFLPPGALPVRIEMLGPRERRITVGRGGRRGHADRPPGVQ